MEKPMEDQEGSDEVFEELSELRVKAPDHTFKRLQKRVRVAQVGKDLIEKQAFGFWKVIDAFLRVLFVGQKKQESKSERGEIE